MKYAGSRSHCRLKRWCNWNFPDPAFEKGDHFFIGLEPVSDIHEVACQQIVSLAHQPDEDVQEVNAVEDDRVVFDILINCLPEE